VKSYTFEQRLEQQRALSLGARADLTDEQLLQWKDRPSLSWSERVRRQALIKAKRKQQLDAIRPPGWPNRLRSEPS
jgi:hypothetical protein